MKPLTWKEIILQGKGLPQFRSEYNIVVPIEYIKSTQKLAIWFGACCFVVGVFVGIAINL